MIGWTDSTTALGASASAQGAARTLQGGQPYNFFSATSFADQAGVLSIQQSLDGAATWQTVASANATANTAASVKAQLTGSTAGASSTSTIVPAQYRVNYANGGAPQTVFRLSSSMSEA
jgi:hypothetical protein